MSAALLPCPFCGAVPDASNPNTFATINTSKYGAVICCITGPEVRTGYKPLEHWRAAAIAAWNDRASAPALVSALEKLVELYALPDEDNNQRFERVAEMFHRETGCMAPGKDVAAASGDAMSYEERRERWEAWYAERAANARHALRLARGEE